ncbi:hypothetical protein KSP40_PGU010893 [Platanthera guangdongensis]|uniref:Uncharacterized protein n=1 Tax=Platanthera guangdongensis TaxID=2320717 RepID=A0ABR2MFZ6_9ASPA
MYFGFSPFYDWTCNSEQLCFRSIHPFKTPLTSRAPSNSIVLNPYFGHVHFIQVITNMKIMGTF